MGKQTDFWAVAMTARTLQETHEILSRLEPPPDSPAATRRDYHLRSVTVYERIANTDRGHHHEAMYVRHEALDFRMEVEDLHRRVVAAA